MIEIKITGTTPLEALASVTAFGMHCMKNQDVHAAATLCWRQRKAKCPSRTQPRPPFPRRRYPLRRHLRRPSHR